jgi:hypothetical protein
MIISTETLFFYVPQGFDASYGCHGTIGQMDMGLEGCGANR